MIRQLRCPQGWAMLDCTCTKPCEGAYEWPPPTPKVVEGRLVLQDPPEKGWRFASDNTTPRREGS